MIDEKLEAMGIERNSKSWQDYERAKQSLPDMDGISYEKAIKEITEYLGL